MNQDKCKYIQDIGEISINLNSDEGDIQDLIENFKKLKQQNSSLLERVQLLESREKIETKTKHDMGSGENLLKVPNNSSSDPSSSISVSPDISCTDSISDIKPSIVQALSSSEEDLDADYNEGKHLDSGSKKKYIDKENTDIDSPGISKKCSQKEHKTAWSKMKEIITTSKVGGAKKRHISEEPFDICKLSEDSGRNYVQKDSRLQAPMLVLTHPSTEDLNRPRSFEESSDDTRKLQQKHRPTPLQPTWQESSPVDEEGSNEISSPLNRKSSKWFKVKNVFLPSPGSHSNKSTSNPSSPLTFKSFTYEVDQDVLSSYDHLEETSHDPSVNIQDEVRKKYSQLQKKLSDEFHCKFVEWEKGRKGGGSFSSGNSSVDECERRRFQETEELRSYGGGPDMNTSPPEKKLTTEFKKKLEEWDRLKSGNDSAVPPSPGREHSRRKISDWQGWGRANSQHRKKDDGKKRRGSDSPTRKEGNSVKELAWIDKELAKVKKEKIRLDKEKEKFNQREARLKKMKLALEASREEILIPTSTGTFRFQGISEKFTKKLYEWEKAKGIGPEASTIALLDPTYSMKTTNLNTGDSTGPCLMRSKSIGSVADLASPSCQLTTHPSSLSLNNVDLLDEPIKNVTPINVEETEATSLNALNLDFSATLEESSQLIDSSGSDLDREIKKLSKDRRGYQYCKESKCLIEKLKKEREMCRELEQNIESLEGRISELSKSLERIDGGGTRSCGIIHEVPFIMNTKQRREREEYRSQEDCHLIQTEEICTDIKEGLNEIWIVSRDQALNEMNHLIDHLLQIIDKLDSWITTENEQSASLVNETRANLDKSDFWMSSNHHRENRNENRMDITSFTNMMKEKINEIRRVLGYLYSKKDLPCRSIDLVNRDDELCENVPLNYSFEHDDKCTEIEMQDTENDCSSRASSFTFHLPEFREKHFDENWDWNKQTNFASFQEDNCFPLQHVKDLQMQCLKENKSCSSFSDIDDITTNNMYKINQNEIKSDFLSKNMSNSNRDLKRWENQETTYEDQYELVNEIVPNIVIPTVRKIFSPIFLEENGETSFIEVVIDDKPPIITETFNIDETCENSDKNIDNIPSNERNDETYKKQSDSFLFLNNDESISYETNKTNYKNTSMNDISNKDDALNKEKENHQPNTTYYSSNDKDPDDFNETDDNKIFLDIGFPPISPLRSRREFRTPKETSSLKRMIAARQNKRLYDDANDMRSLRSESSSPDSRSSGRTSESKIDKNEKRFYNTISSDFTKSASASHMRTMSSDRCLKDLSSNPILPSKGILKSSSTSALKYPSELDHGSDIEEIMQRKSLISESISQLEEKGNSSNQNLSTPDSLRLRALKIQKAKEDFFNIQFQQETFPKMEQNNDCNSNRHIQEIFNPVDVKEEENFQFKSASEGTINETQNRNGEKEPTPSKQKSTLSGLALRFNNVLRRSGTSSADSSLRRSLAVPTSHRIQQNEEVEPTRSCPSSPILLRDEPTWWSFNSPKKIFKPKGKYKINNKQ